MGRRYGDGLYGEGTYGEARAHPVDVVYEGALFLGNSVDGLRTTPPPSQSGDVIYFQTLIYAPHSTVDVEFPAVPFGWVVICQDSVSEAGVVVGWMAVFGAAPPLDPAPEFPNPMSMSGRFTLDWPVNAEEDMGIFVGRWLVVRNVVAENCQFAGPYIDANGSTAAITMTGGIDAVLQTVMSTGHGSFGTRGLAGYVRGATVRRNESIGAWFATWTRELDATITEPAWVTTIDDPDDLGETGVYWLVTFAFTGTAPSVPVELGDYRRLALDCADTYSVFVTGPDYATIVGQVGWSQIEWNRALDEISTATVMLPDRLGGARCCMEAGGLLPWRYGLLIERNDQAVWSGPVTTVARQAQALRVNASDVMSRFQHRLVSRRDRTFSNRDSGRVFASLTNEAQFESDLWGFAAPIGLTGEVITRKIVARDFEMSYDVLQELANTSVDFFVLNGYLYVRDVDLGWVCSHRDNTQTVLEGPYTAANEFGYGTFTEDAWAERPSWTINGAEQANAVWISGPDAGEEGVRRFWVAQDLLSQSFDGVLDFVDNDPTFRPEDEDIPDAVFQFGAESSLALRRVAPAVIEGGTLAQGAPMDIPNLRPGSLWACDIFDACFGQLLQVARLKRVQVTVNVSESGMTEVIAPTLIPPGASRIVVGEPAAADSGGAPAGIASTNLPPTAEFTSAPTDLDVVFTSTALASDPDGTIVDWAWDFGDGDTDTVADPSHTYATAGTYTVTLTVIDDGGLTDDVIYEVTVEDPNLPPVAEFTWEVG